MIEDTIKKRRTFAIISHPDAGKTTLTEKLLLFGGAIQMAGMVKAKKDNRHARSDWLKVEQERGISVASSVMTFEYRDCTFNLLDTPGHEDFSEDTYRVLTAVDSAVMVIDAAKGIEEQTRKLFEVCRLRSVPIITFINKLDREGLEPFALLDDIEQSLALDVSPASWPLGMGRDFLGCYDIVKDQLLLMDKTGSKGKIGQTIFECRGLDDKKLEEQLPSHVVSKLREEIEMARGLCQPISIESYLEGNMTPVFFGSAINNFGVKELLDNLVEMAPYPKSQKTSTREIKPDEDKVSGFIFKIQANMDPKHRDRIAFMRLCSGHFKRGMKLFHTRSSKEIKLQNPVMFMANERELAEEAFAGDIIGIPNHGNLRIGDTLTEGEKISFTGIPCFAPEILQKVRAKDPLKTKHLSKALFQIAEEGGASVFKSLIGSEWIVGVVGNLQFEVMSDRIRTEYDIDVIFESSSLYTARWITSDDDDELKKFVSEYKPNIAEDHDDASVFLARNAWHLERAAKDYPKIKFMKVKEQG
ncbi:MAG: peptide chain release factor 3 [Alphaproteobacteria bacterium]